MTLDRLYACLEEWRDYYKHSNVETEFGLGYPKSAAVIQCGGASSVDAFDNMCEEIDSLVVRHIDSMVDSLIFPQRDAIKHKWLGDATCWPTHDLDYEEALFNLLRLAEKRGLE